VSSTQRTWRLWSSIASVAALACSGETGSDGAERQAGDPARDADPGSRAEPAADGDARPETGSPADEPDAGMPSTPEPTSPPSIAAPNVRAAPDSSVAPAPTPGLDAGVPVEPTACADAAADCDAGTEQPSPLDSCVDGLDTRRCQGNVPQRCESGEWTSESACFGHCLQETGWCVQCEPALEECGGGLRHRCSENGNWESEADPSSVPGIRGSSPGSTQDP
jgi:hypothetical protein